MHARRIRPDTGPTDRRRLAAAGLSAVLPGLGQAFNHRRQLALWFIVPSLILLAIGLLVIRLQSPARLARLGGRAGRAERAPPAQPPDPDLAPGRRRAGLPRHGPPGPDRPARDRRRRPHRPVRGRPAPAGLAVRDARRGDVQEHLRRPGPERDRSERLAASRLDRADQRPAARGRCHRRAHHDPDRHDDRGLARSGRPHGLDGVGATRPGRRPARHRRRLRTEAQLADVVRRPPPRRIPEGRRPDARGRHRGDARDRHPVLRAGRLQGVRRDGRRRRRRGHRRQEEAPGAALRRLRTRRSGVRGPTRA